MLGGHPFDNPQPWFPPPGLSFFHPSLGASFVPSSYLEELRLSLSYLHIGGSSVPSSIRSCRQRLSSSGRAMVHPPRAPTPVSCRPPTCLHVEGQGGGPAPMELLHLSPHAAKRSRPQAVGAWRAPWPLLAAFPPLSTPTRRMASRSLFGAWLHGKATLGRFSIAWFQGPVAWPPINLKHAASGSGVVLCCFGRVSVHDERADPCTEQLAARLYRSCGPDAAVKSVIRVNFKSTCSSCSEHIRRC